MNNWSPSGRGHDSAYPSSILPLHDLMERVNGAARLHDTFGVEFEDDARRNVEQAYWPIHTEASPHIIRLWWEGHALIQADTQARLGRAGRFYFVRRNPRKAMTSVFQGVFELAHYGFVLQWTVTTRNSVRHQCGWQVRGLVETLHCTGLWLQQDYAFTDLDWRDAGKGQPPFSYLPTTETLWEVTGTTPPAATWFALPGQERPGGRW